MEEYGGEHHESAKVSASAAKLRVTGSPHESATKGRKSRSNAKEIAVESQSRVP